MNINVDHSSEYFAIILDILVPISDANKEFMRFMIVNAMRRGHHMLIRHQSSSAKSVKIASFPMFDAEKIGKSELIDIDHTAQCI